MGALDMKRRGWGGLLTTDEAALPHTPASPRARSRARARSGGRCRRSDAKAGQRTSAIPPFPSTVEAERGRERGGSGPEARNLHCSAGGEVRALPAIWR